MAEWVECGGLENRCPPSGGPGVRSPLSANQNHSHPPAGGWDFCFMAFRLRLASTRKAIKQKYLTTERSKGMILSCWYLPLGSPKAILSHAPHERGRLKNKNLSERNSLRSNLSLHGSPNWDQRSYSRIFRPHPKSMYSPPCPSLCCRKKGAD